MIVCEYAEGNCCVNLLDRKKVQTHPMFFAELISSLSDPEKNSAATLHFRTFCCSVEVAP